MADEGTDAIATQEERYEERFAEIVDGMHSSLEQFQAADENLQADADAGTAELRAAEHEISMAMAEIRAQIADAKKLRDELEGSPTISDEISRMQSDLSTLAALSLPANATATEVANFIQHVHTTISGVQSGGAPEMRSESGEIWSDKYESAYNAWEKSREISALANYYADKFKDEFSEEVVRHSVMHVSELHASVLDKGEKHVDGVIHLTSSVIENSPERKRQAGIVGAAEEEIKESVFEISERALNNYRQLMQDLPDGHPLKERLQEMIGETTRIEKDGETKFLFTVEQAEYLQRAMNGERSPELKNQIGNWSRQAKRANEMILEEVVAYLSPEMLIEVQEYFEAKGVEFDPENPDVSLIDHYINHYPQRNGSALGIIKDSVSAIQSTQTLAQSILQLQSLQQGLDKLKAASFSLESQLAAMEIPSDMLKTMSDAEKEMMRTQIMDMVALAEESPERISGIAESIQDSGLYLAQRHGIVPPVDRKLSAQEWSLIARKGEIEKEAYEMAIKEAHEKFPASKMTPGGYYSLDRIPEYIEKRVAELRAEQMQDLASEGDNLSVMKTLFSEMHYNPETGNYEDKDKQMSIARDIAEAQAEQSLDTVATLNEETGNLETHNMSVAPTPAVAVTDGNGSIIGVHSGAVAGTAITPANQNQPNPYLDLMAKQKQEEEARRRAQEQRQQNLANFFESQGGSPDAAKQAAAATAGAAVSGGSSVADVSAPATTPVASPSPASPTKPAATGSGDASKPTTVTGGEEAPPEVQEGNASAPAALTAEEVKKVQSQGV